MESGHKTAAQLRDELREAEQVEAAARKARADAFEVRFAYEIRPSDGLRSNHKMYDPTCSLYRLSRHCLNEPEATEAGVDSFRLNDGGMDYLYNHRTNMIICSVGGGTLYVSSNRWMGDDDRSDEVAMSYIGLFLRDNPSGGDITSIVDEYNARRNRS